MDELTKKIATDLIAEFEGCEKRKPDGKIYPYLDKLAKPNVWTRGYGRTYGIEENSPPITKEEAKAELQVGAVRYGKECLKLSPSLIALSKCWAAVTSWSWNCGVSRYKVSRLRMAINEGRLEDAIEHIKTPITAGGKVYNGLIRRRNRESSLFESGVNERKDSNKEDLFLAFVKGLTKGIEFKV